MRRMRREGGVRRRMTCDIGIVVAQFLAHCSAAFLKIVSKNNVQTGVWALIPQRLYNTLIPAPKAQDEKSSWFP
jgi:hypothetical protein